MHCGNEPGMPDCSPIGTVLVSRPRKVGERANDGPPPDLLGADARSHGPGGDTTPTQDGMIAECQRANAEPRRQRDTALARGGSDYADRLTAAVRDGRPGYRGFGSDSGIGSSISSVQGVKLSSHDLADGAPKASEGKRRFDPLSMPGA